LIWPAEKKLALRGRIDRVDLFRDENGSSRRNCSGLQIKPEKNWNALFVETRRAVAIAGVSQRVAALEKSAGKFFGREAIDFRREFFLRQTCAANTKGGGSRAPEILADADAARRMAYRPHGKILTQMFLDRLDRTGAADQFNYRRNNDGSLRKGSVEAMPRDEF